MVKTALHGARLRGLAAAIAITSFAAVAALVAYVGARAIGRDVLRALPALPAALGIHAAQLFLSALAWRALIASPPGAGAMLRARWVREAANTLLPFAGLGGGVAGARMLAGRDRIGVAEASAATVGDLTTEALAQLPFLLLSLAVVAASAPSPHAVRAAWLAVLPIAAGVFAFILAQRWGLLRVVERAASRLGAADVLVGLHDRLLALHLARARVARSVLFHFVSWSLGGAEVWAVFRAMHVPVSAAAAFAIEGLGMAARSAGFALPAGLAAQEAGFVLACAAFNLPATDALALSMLKRLRELIVALTGAALALVSRRRT